MFFIFQCLSLQSIFSSVMILNLIFGKFVFLLLSVCFCHDSLRSSCISVKITGIILFQQCFCVSLGPLCQFVVIVHAFQCALCLFKLIFIYTFLSFSGCGEYLWGFSSLLGVFAVISYLFLVILWFYDFCLRVYDFFLHVCPYFETHLLAPFCAVSHPSCLSQWGLVFLSELLEKTIHDKYQLKQPFTLRYTAPDQHTHLHTQAHTQAHTEDGVCCGWCVRLINTIVSVRNGGHNNNNSNNDSYIHPVWGFTHSLLEPPPYF